MPGALAERFNTDPVLVTVLVAVAALHLSLLRRDHRGVAPAAAGWLIAGGAFLSPLCALSVALFSARVGQHMILLLLAAPLIASSLPLREEDGASPWPPALGLFAALWFWHMPGPYDATFRSSAVYWAMHLTLFGSGIWLWRALLGHGRAGSLGALAAGTATSMQMGLLGAVLTLSSRPLFPAHYLTTEAWGLSPLADQQLGGALMWVPGCLLFLGVALRSLGLLWRSLEPIPAR